MVAMSVDDKRKVASRCAFGDQGTRRRVHSKAVDFARDAEAGRIALQVQKLRRTSTRAEAAAAAAAAACVASSEETAAGVGAKSSGAKASARVSVCVGVRAETAKAGALVVVRAEAAPKAAAESRHGEGVSIAFVAQGCVNASCVLSGVRK